MLLASVSLVSSKLIDLNGGVSSLYIIFLFLFQAANESKYCLV